MRSAVHGRRRCQPISGSLQRCPTPLCLLPEKGLHRQRPRTAWRPKWHALRRTCSRAGVMAESPRGNAPLSDGGVSVSLTRPVIDLILCSCIVCMTCIGLKIAKAISALSTHISYHSTSFHIPCVPPCHRWLPWQTYPPPWDLTSDE